jgi:hypothetical protein
VAQSARPQQLAAPIIDGAFWRSCAGTYSVPRFIREGGGGAEWLRLMVDNYNARPAKAGTALVPFHRTAGGRGEQCKHTSSSALLSVEDPPVVASAARQE